MTTEMQAGVVEAPEAAEGLGLLDQIVMQSKVAVTDTEKLSARDQIAELVEEVLAGTVTISMDLAASIDMRIAQLDELRIGDLGGLDRADGLGCGLRGPDAQAADEGGDGKGKL